MTEASRGGNKKKKIKGKKKSTRRLSSIDSSLLIPTPHAERGKGWEIPLRSPASSRRSGDRQRVPAGWLPGPLRTPEQRGRRPLPEFQLPPRGPPERGARGGRAAIPGARGQTPGCSAAGSVPLERERAGGSSPAGSRGGRAPRGASLRRPLHPTWPDHGNEGGAAAGGGRGECIQPGN